MIFNITLMTSFEVWIVCTLHNFLYHYQNWTPESRWKDMRMLFFHGSIIMNCFVVIFESKNSVVKDLRSDTESSGDFAQRPIAVGGTRIWLSLSWWSAREWNEWTVGDMSTGYSKVAVQWAEQGEAGRDEWMKGSSSLWEQQWDKAKPRWSSSNTVASHGNKSVSNADNR